MSPSQVNTAETGADKNDLESAQLTAEVQNTPTQRMSFQPTFQDTPPFAEVLERSWFDILTQLLCALAALLIYLFAAPLLPHHFPLYAGLHTSPWGLKHGRPYLREYINTTVSAVVSFAAPLLIIGAAGLWKTRRFWGTHAAIMGLGYALATATLFQAFVKWIVGGLRPHFLSLCNPNMPLRLGNPDPQGIWYRPQDVCTGDEKKLREAQMSFPSGHACAAFAGFGFLSLYLNSTLAIFKHKQREGSRWGATGHWRLLVFVAPLLAALLIAASKVRDGWHHPVDVVAGAMIGSTFAIMAFMMVSRNIRDGSPWGSN